MVANGILWKVPSIPYIPSLLIRTVSDNATLEALYLTRAYRNAVNFQGALEAAKASLLVDEQTMWLENGLHQIYLNMITGTLSLQTRIASSLKMNTDFWTVLDGGLVSLYLYDINIRLDECH